MDQYKQVLHFFIWLNRLTTRRNTLITTARSNEHDVYRHSSLSLPFSLSDDASRISINNRQVWEQSIQSVTLSVLPSENEYFTRWNPLTFSFVHLNLPRLLLSWHCNERARTRTHCRIRLEEGERNRQDFWLKLTEALFMDISDLLKWHNVESQWSKYILFHWP